MSELIDNARRRKDLLKHMILELHAGRAPEAVRPQLIRLLGEVPYGDVVAVEQEMIAEGLPVEEILRLCDVHTAALQGAISQTGARTAPEGHPVHTFQQENRALEWEIESLESLLAGAQAMAEDAEAKSLVHLIRERFNHLMDVEKHYLRKEHLLFPYLERHGIKGPPTVMWGKHDETRRLLRGAMDALGSAAKAATAGEIVAMAALVLRPAMAAISGMIDKEERILFPMCLDTLADREWVEIARGSAEIGFCLVDPADEWKPDLEAPEEPEGLAGPIRVNLPSGSFTPEELAAVLNTIPFDLTFVDREDTVRYFTQGKERIFARTRAILGRKVQYCHPPSSVDVVEQILDAFKSGRRDRAAFWIEMGGRFLSIEYFALRGGGGEYLGCLEVSQDLTAKRALTGERRLLAWDEDEPDGLP
ncbi:MAG: DUF438 domain-containing protein [Candidatus Eisenbacteria bacterium]|nr:DUF438 domain-containing protein [Candidatus Eisenbacteria bacterium]